MQNTDYLISQKNKIVDTLISQLKSTDNYNKGNQIAFALIDNFKDEQIENCLFDLITSTQWKSYNGTLLYALGEYSNNKKYLYFLIDLILKNENDGEIFMSAYSMVLNLHPPFNKKELTKSIQRVKRESKKKNLSREKKN
jgi:hypothetical protein